MSDGPRSYFCGPGRRACGDECPDGAVQATAAADSDSDTTTDGDAVSYSAADCGCDARTYSEAYRGANAAADLGTYRGSHGHACDTDSCACFVGSGAHNHGPGGEGHLQRAGGHGPSGGL